MYGGPAGSLSAGDLAAAVQQSRFPSNGLLVGLNFHGVLVCARYLPSFQSGCRCTRCHNEVM